MRKDINLQDQLRARQGWSDAMVDAVVATVLVRSRADGESVLDKYEMLVTERMKGAEKNQFQAHHGGFLKTTDPDIYAGATREVLEETGFVLHAKDLRYVMSIGPGMYRSELFYEEHDPQTELVLRISEVEAEPNVAFCLPVFFANVDGKVQEQEKDEEVANASWMTLRCIIDKFGCQADREYSQFNYFQILVPVILAISGQWTPGTRPKSFPGEYRFSFK